MRDWKSGNTANRSGSIVSTASSGSNPTTDRTLNVRNVSSGKCSTS